MDEKAWMITTTIVACRKGGRFLLSEQGGLLMFTIVWKGDTVLPRDREFG